MPTYEYVCKSCGKNFDVFQNMSDEPVKTCPICGEGVKRKINGGMGVIFKGSGFYKNDSRKAGSSFDANSASSSGAAPASSTASTAAPACASCPAAPACDTPKKETA